MDFYNSNFNSDGFDSAKFLRFLESGKLRAAILNEETNIWTANPEVKRGILELFKMSKVVAMGTSAMYDLHGNKKPITEYSPFCDKDTFVPRQFSLDDKIRIVPGGTSIRPGAYVGSGVVIMPPSYINVGSYVDNDTMIDSHALVGSCAQIGKRVHISAGVQICGVLEPVGNTPVIVENDCFIGANVVLAEGVVIRNGAVIAPGTTITAGIPIYDTVKQQIYKNEVPACAVVVPGTRKISSANAWTAYNELSLGCAIIVKYRNDKTDRSVMMEELLRADGAFFKK